MNSIYSKLHLIVVLCVMMTFLLGIMTSAESVVIIANPQGYVDSSECATCHASHAKGFQHVGMSQSFSKATSSWLTDEKRRYLPFFHSPSQRYYDFTTNDGKLIFHRYQLDEQDKKINDISKQVDYLLGSGNKTTSLIFRTDNDELFQLPVNWYSELPGWEMSPGYEQKQHFGLSRQILRECMFCHNAYPQEEMNHDHYWQRDTFPEVLKTGIDCQRCHGPGKHHLQQVYSPNTDLKAIRSSIVNPAKLDAVERDSVCLQCHMLPSVSLMGMRRFQRTDYSFRPGEILSDYLVHVDVRELNNSHTNRFEINHHGFRFKQSQCYQQSAGELTCIGCHNLHEKPSEADFLKSVETQCRTCHANDLTISHNTVDINSQHCVTCHMPQKRAQDVVHVNMTDHKIGVYRNWSELTAPIKKTEPILTEITLYDESVELPTDEEEIYQLSAILQATPSLRYAQHLKTRLQNSNYPHLTPYLVLAEAFMKMKSYSEALKALNFMKNKFGRNIRILELMTTVYVAMDDGVQAERGFSILLSLDSENADIFFNYGMLKFKQQDFSQAFHRFSQAVELKNNFAIAVMYQGLSLEALEKNPESMHYFIESLKIEPTLERSYVHLIQRFLDAEQWSEAKRYYKVALVNLGQTKSLIELGEILEELNHQ